MIEIWTVLLPILIADMVNPVLFAFMVFAAGTRRPIVNSSAILVGHALAYFSVGIFMALGLQRITDRLMNPHTMDYVIGLLIGILLLWFTFKPGKKEEKSKASADDDLSPSKRWGQARSSTLWDSPSPCRISRRSIRS